MQFIARVEGSYGVHFVRIAPLGSRFETNVRPRPAVGSLITITFDGLSAVNHESLELWRAGHAPTNELDRRNYRQTALSDLMSAVNAELFLAIDRTADEAAAFALDRGGALLSAIRAELAGRHEVVIVTQQARRFAAILGIESAAESLAALAELHAVEQLMGLEHAVVSWMRDAPDDELAALTKALPLDRASAGASAIWLQWWWRLSRACTRQQLRVVVQAVVEAAHRECRYGTRAAIATHACDEAERMAELARIANRAEMWAGMPAPIELSEILRDDNDAHYASYMAVTHAAHAIAAALVGELSAAEANSEAMKLVALAALHQLR